MKTRKRRLIQTNRSLEVWDSPPSPEEIIELARLSRGRCAISGILGHWSLSEHLIPPPFLLEFDHMVPISMGGSFGKQNLQVLIRCLNQVKGNHSDDELRRWLKAFRETNTLTIKTLAKKR
ncbi:hypothetical protein A0J61_00339 [Choanephora cucurbitarum]|uniref:HNH nuclease domain-containing protein n=1 Tax=Choanephora cucurbitarum TaxID=101091 RepID=A0A1C7NR92_9FUNG|nr:hypothetical protein A0J61_00339 [Choanephora cucurbitarum]